MSFNAIRRHSHKDFCASRKEFVLVPWICSLVVSNARMRSGNFSGSGTMTSVFDTRIIVRITTETEPSHKDGRGMTLFSCDKIIHHSKNTT